MDDTGIDPFTRQLLNAENWFEVRQALTEAGRTDLIGDGRDALIPAQPPKEALEARRTNANQALGGSHVHTVPNPKHGYRPGRKTQERQVKPGRGKK